MLLDSSESSLSLLVAVERASSITNKDIEDQTEHSMIVGHSLSVSTTSSTWCIDNGASRHVHRDIRDRVGVGGSIG